MILTCRCGCYRDGHAWAIMLALVGTVMLRSASRKVLLRDGDKVLGTHTPAGTSLAGLSPGKRIHMTSGSGCGPAPAGLSIVEGAERLGVDPAQVWIEYLAMGGHLTAAEVRAVLDGTQELEPREYNFLAAALNDYFVDRGENHAVAYRHDSGVAIPPWDERFLS